MEDGGLKMEDGHGMKGVLDLVIVCQRKKMKSTHRHGIEIVLIILTSITEDLHSVTLHKK